MNLLSKNTLKNLNLSESESSVYLTTLELGQVSMADLARKSGVNRATIYSFMPELKERGLISEIRLGKRTLYCATDPSFLLELERARLAEFELSLPELQAIYNRRLTKPRVKFFDGILGLKEVYSDILRTKQMMYVFGDFEYSSKLMGKEYIENFVAERVKSNIEYNAILRDSAVARAWAERNRRDLRETRFIHDVDFATEIDIYGDKVALMSFRGDRPMAVVIEDTDIATTLRAVWGKLWSHLENE